MDIIEDGTCFACGHRNPAGLQLQFALDAESMRATAHTLLDVRFSGWRRAAHGGIITALLDEAMVYACGAAGMYVATASLTVRFRNPVPVETRLRIEGWVTQQRSRIFRARSHILLDEKRLAEADGMFAPMRPIHSNDPIAALRTPCPEASGRP